MALSGSVSGRVGRPDGGAVRDSLCEESEGTIPLSARSSCKGWSRFAGKGTALGKYGSVDSTLDGCGGCKEPEILNKIAGAFSLTRGRPRAGISIRSWLHTWGRLLRKTTSFHIKRTSWPTPPSSVSSITISGSSLTSSFSDQITSLV